MAAAEKAALSRLPKVTVALFPHTPRSRSMANPLNRWQILITDRDALRSPTPLTVSGAAGRASAAPSLPSPGPGERKGRPARSGTRSGRKHRVFIPSSFYYGFFFLVGGLVVASFYLHEHFDVLVLPQEISAQRHPLRHQVQDFALPLRRLPPVLFGSALLGAVGGGGNRLRPFLFFLTSQVEARFADIRQTR